MQLRNLKNIKNSPGRKFDEVCICVSASRQCRMFGDTCARGSVMGWRYVTMFWFGGPPERLGRPSGRLVGGMAQW